MMDVRSVFAALSAERLMVLILLLCVFFMASQEITDPDFWWHLRTGQYISQSNGIPRQDPFSHSIPNRPWITHEWLTEITIYAIHDVSGQEGLILTFAAIITATFALLYLRCPGRPYLASFVVIWAAITSAVTWNVRPQMLSLLLSAIMLLILHLYAQGRRKAIWLMPPVMMVWANLHGSFFLGLVFPAVYIVGGTITRLVGSDDGQALDWRGTRLLLLATVVSGVVTVVNPNGLQLLLYPFSTLGSTAMQTYIAEWFSPDFHQIQFQPLALFMILLVAALALSRQTLSATDLLFLIGFGYASLRSARHIPFFALTAAPILSSQLLDIWQESRWSERFMIRRQQRTPTLYLAFNWLVLFLVILGGGVTVSLALQNNGQAQQDAFPVDAVDFLLEERITGNMYNLYHWGGYLIWRLYPDQQVFIDGRADVYGDAFIDEYLQVYQVRANWREPLEKYGVNLVIIDEGSSLSTVLSESPEWERRYVDEIAAVFVQRTEGGW